MTQITSKDLSLINDQLKHESQAWKKYTAYQAILSDPALKSFVQELAQHHQQNFDALNNYLNQH